MKTLITLLVLVSAIGAATAQTQPAPRLMAKPGQEVEVWAYPVKADKLAHYERFAHTIF
ncbi:MAG: hypothetical protein LH609_13695 [Rudanella sp.]|nr:hypothetical protein [Rudanella sp.]